MSGRGGSMRRQLLGLLLGTVALAWGAAALFAYRDAQREIDRLLDAHLAQAAHLLVAQVGHEVEEIEFDDDDDSPYGSVVAFQVWERDGRLRVRSGNAPAQRLSPVDAGFSDAQLAGVHWRVYGAWGEKGAVLVQVAEDHATRDRIARSIARNALLPLLLALPLLALAIGWIVQRGTQPLRALSDEIEARGPDDLDPIATRRLPDEVRPLASRLDGLFARIRDSIAAERRFTSHAAHELRTPIAAIRAQAEVARDSHDADERGAALRHAIEGCDRAARLMEQLLLLARADEADLASRHSACDLVAIARRLLADVAPSADEAGVVVGLEAAADVDVQGDAALLEAALRNLVDNAIRHGGPGTEVRVTIARDGGDACITVEDTGPGVPDADLALLGRRFHRGAATEASGSGLGLSIVARVVEQHRGSVRFGAGVSGRGLRVELRLPAGG